MNPFARQLLTWFDQHGRKHLPWQQNKTPYRVWVSEIMLQQTQVTTVIPYFERFMHRLPDITSLATASEDVVLHLWAGLGYYSRARNLHRAAKMVVDNFGGVLPANANELISLAGIGRSTAGAILAIAFDQPSPILDGNVKRVLARFHGICEPVNDKAVEQRMWQLAAQHTPTTRTADYTQAIMDLGATLCTRSKPRCDDCPLLRNCVAHAQNKVSELPVKKAAKKIPTKSATFLLVRHGKKILLYKRPASGIWGGLWSLPEFSGEPNEKKLRQFCLLKFGSTPIELQTLPGFRHTFSHYHLEIYPVAITLGQLSVKVMESEQQIWYNPRKPSTLGLPKPIQTLLSKMT